MFELSTKENEIIYKKKKIKHLFEEEKECELEKLIRIILIIGLVSKNALNFFLDFSSHRPGSVDIKFSKN